MSTLPETPDDADLLALAKALAALIGIPLDHAFEPGVIANLRICLHHAAIVLDGSPGDHDDPAPVFRP